MYIPNELIQLIKDYVFYICSTCKIEKTDIEDALFIRKIESREIYMCRDCFNSNGCIII